MDMKTRLESEITLLSNEIKQDPFEHTFYLERGKLYHRCGQYDKALNDFIRVKELFPEHTEAKEYIVMISEIFDFRYTDIYNP